MANVYYKLGVYADTGSFLDRASGLQLRGKEVNYIDSVYVNKTIERLIQSGFLVSSNVGEYNDYKAATAQGTRISYENTLSDLRKIIDNNDFQNSVDKIAMVLSDLEPSAGFRVIMGADDIVGYDGMKDLVGEFDGWKWTFVAPWDGFCCLVNNLPGIVYIYKDANFPSGVWAPFNLASPSPLTSQVFSLTATVEGPDLADSRFGDGTVMILTTDGQSYDDGFFTQSTTTLHSKLDGDGNPRLNFYPGQRITVTMTTP